MRFVSVILLLFAHTTFLMGQQLSGPQKLDSLKQKFLADSAHTYRFKKFRPFFAFDNRNSFIRDAPVNFKGLQLGFVYKERNTIGVGVYKITQNSKRPVRRREGGSLINQELTLNYITNFYQRALVDKRYYEVDLALEVGLGNANIRLTDSINNKVLREDKIPIVPLGAGFQVVLKPFKWVGVSFMSGYRYVNEKGKNLNFNGSYYSIGIWLDVRQVYRDVKFYGFQRKKYRRNVKALSAN